MGPNERIRYPSTRLASTEHGLRFEVYLPGDETRLLAYDLTFTDGAMTGTVTFVRHGLTAPGHRRSSAGSEHTSAARDWGRAPLLRR